MGDSYTVDTGVLRQVAGSLGSQASDAGTLLDRADAADVPSGSWGLLGHALGLHELYTDVRDQADASLNGIQDFLQWSSQTLADTAGQYDEHEQSTASAFRSLAGEKAGS